MSEMASQITGVLTIYSTVGSDADQRKYQSSAALAFARVTDAFPAQRASNAENVSFDDVFMLMKNVGSSIDLQLALDD